MPLKPDWTDTVDRGINDKSWDDLLIQKEVLAYNQRFAGSPGFISLDWKLFKAMVWVESGGPGNAAWKTRPMQIGNSGDPGYAALKGGQDATLLIMSQTLSQEIKTGDITDPSLNIRTGIAYALNRLVRSDLKSVDDVKDCAVKEYVVMAGDSLSKIAGKVGSTDKSMQALNPAAQVLKPGQKLKYRKAKIQRAISGWQVVNTAKVGATYNAGDPHYKEKLDYVLALFPKLKRPR